MPDIGMCTDIECSRKEQCYRFMAVPYEYMQSYLTESHRNKETGECNWLLPIGDKRIKNHKNDDLIFALKYLII